MASNYKNESELLKLLNSRAAFNLPPYRKPVVSGQIAHDNLMATRLHAEANPSDPFAKNRMALYLRQGFELASDVSNDARNKLSARRGQ